MSDFPVPVDDLGNSDTSANRNNPHDYVLPGLSFTNFETATIFPTHTYSNGLVFDSRVYSNLSDFIPVQPADSGLAQHMAVIKDFTLGSGGMSSNAAPSIITSPRSQTIATGSNAVFTVTAAGTAPLAYQWRFAGTNISGASAGVFTINNVQLTNAGDYSALITNSVGSVTSSVAVLAVSNFPPVILAQPQSQTVNAGGSASFIVSAGGSLPLDYRWHFNDTNDLVANTNRYTLGNVQSSNAGNYSVIITNAGGSITSIVAALTVNSGVTGTVTMLAGWDVSAQSGFGPSPMPPTVSAPNLHIAGLTRSSGITTTPTAAARAWGGNGFDSTSSARCDFGGRLRHLLHLGRRRLPCLIHSHQPVRLPPFQHRPAQRGAAISGWFSRVCRYHHTFLRFNLQQRRFVGWDRSFRHCRIAEC